jgi:hypothetical protein
MPTQKVGKNLPKRCSNAHAKETRKAAWVRGEVRKGKRRAAQEAAHKANLELVAAGGRTAGGRTSWPRQRLHGEAKAAVRPARWVIELPPDVRRFSRPDGRVT